MKWIAFAVLAALGTAGCGGAKGTFVLARFEAEEARPPVGDVWRIDLDLALGARHEQLTLRGPAGKAFTLPTDTSLEVGRGEGRLTITAVARDAGGATVGGGVGSVEVLRDGIARVTVVLAAGGGGDGSSDGGVRAGDAGSGDGRELADGGGGPGGDLANEGRADGGVVDGQALRDVVGDGAGVDADARVGAASDTSPSTDAPAGSDMSMSSFDTAASTSDLPQQPVPDAPSALPDSGSPPDDTAAPPLDAAPVGGAKLAISPATATFGTVMVGSTSAFTTFTFTNGGTEATGALSVKVEGADSAQYELGSGTCEGQPLAVGSSCMVDVRFAPTAGGLRSATLAVTAQPGGRASAPLTGTGRDFMYTLTVTVTASGGAAGTVKSAAGVSPAIDCSPTCSGKYTSGTQVTLTANPTMHYFGGWGGDCTGFDTCVVTVTADRTVTAKFAPANLMFVTSQAYMFDQIQGYGPNPSTPNATGMLAGADVICNMAALKAGLPGTYVAWLAANGIPAYSRVGTARGWLRTDGKPFADVLGQPSPDQIFYPPEIDENKQASPMSVNTQELVLTGANATGGPAMAENCSNWTQKTGLKVVVGHRRGGTQTWMTYPFNTTGCGNFAWPLYCLAIDQRVRVTVPAPPAGTKVVFLSSVPFNPSTGMAAADALCNTDGQARFGRPFKALLTPSDNPFGSRVTLTDAPVARPDGVVVASRDRDLTMATMGPSPLLAPLTLMADGSTYVSGFAFTGRKPNVYPPVDANCLDWTTDVTLSVTSGFTSLATTFWAVSGYNSKCSEYLRIYCLAD